MVKCTFIGGSKDGDREEIRPFVKIIVEAVPDQPAGLVKDGTPPSHKFREEAYNVIDIKDMDGRTYVVAVLDEDGHRRPFGKLLEHYNPKSEVETLRQQIEDYKIALADAIRRPMGVLPSSAEGLVTEEEVMEAEQRRSIRATPR